MRSNFLAMLVATLVAGHCLLAYAEQSKVDELLSETSKATTSMALDFQQSLREKGSNLDATRAVDDVRKLIRDLEENSRRKNRGEVFECRPLQDAHALFIAASQLVELSLADDPTESRRSSRVNNSKEDVKRGFQSSFREFQQSCKPEDVARGKKFLDDISTTLEGLREQRKVELARRQAAKDENVRLEAEGKKSLEASRAAKKADEEQAIAALRQQDELFRQERRMLLKSGKLKPVSASDAIMLLDAVDGMHIAYNPPYKPDQRMYSVRARLDRWFNNILIFKVGPNKEFWVLPTKATIFIGDTQERLAVGSYVHVTGKLMTVMTDMRPIFEASYISIR